MYMEYAILGSPHIFVTCELLSHLTCYLCPPC